MNASHDQDELITRIRALSTQLQPIPTEQTPRIEPLGDIRAVVFDIYGTLFISGSGDVGTHAASDSAVALRDAMAAAGMEMTPEIAERAVGLLHMEIAERHAASRASGVEHPEVDIRDVWAGVLVRLAHEGGLVATAATADAATIARLAVEYECRVNPVWPMPHLPTTLTMLRGAVEMGIVSNAQFITPLLFPALLGRAHTDLGFDASLCRFSYERGEAKPSTRLYEPVAQALSQRSIGREQTLYVGNDMRNDVGAAAAVGFRTALFAGDQRSLRWRLDDAHLADVEPDAVITELTQILQLIDS